MKNRMHVVFAYISNFIEQYHLSEKEFCEKCGITVWTLNKIKYNNYTKVLFEDVMNICSFMNIPIEKLIVDLDNY